MIHLVDRLELLTQKTQENNFCSVRPLDMLTRKKLVLLNAAGNSKF